MGKLDRGLGWHVTRVRPPIRRGSDFVLEYRRDRAGSGPAAAPPAAGSADTTLTVRPYEAIITFFG